MYALGDLIEAMDDYKEAEEGFNTPHSVKEYYGTLMLDAEYRAAIALRELGLIERDED